MYLKLQKSYSKEFFQKKIVDENIDTYEQSQGYTLHKEELVQNIGASKIIINKSSCNLHHITMNQQCGCLEVCFSLENLKKEQCS